MQPYYEHAGITIYHGDCRLILPVLPPDSVDLVWTDPPYGHSNHEGDWNSRLNEERYCEIAAKRLSQEVLDFTEIPA